MRNILTVSLLAALVLFGLSACDGGSGSSSSTTEPSIFSRIFGTSSNVEPATVNAGDAGAVDPNAEPHSI